MPALKRHPLVRADLQIAYDWYEDEQPGLGGEFRDEFFARTKNSANARCFTLSVFTMFAD
jgi:hypothetical protein